MNRTAVTSRTSAPKANHENTGETRAARTGPASFSRQPGMVVSPAVTLLFSLIISCSGNKKSPAGTEYHTIGRAHLRDVISQTGEVRPLVKVELKCEASGKIESVFVKEGQRVERGDPIIVIDPLRLINRKKSLDLSVEEAKIRLNLASRDLEQARELAKTGSISEKELEDLESEYKLKKIGWQRQLLELEDVTDQLQKTRVTAPMSGVLTALNVEEGEIAVSATSGYQSGTSIGTIADIGRLEVVTSVGEVDYIHLSTGQPVVIRPEAREHARTTGTIDFISLTAKKENNSELGTFEVRVSIDSVIAGIAPGINVNVEFVILEKKNVPAVPNHFVKEGRKGRQTVMVAPDVDAPLSACERRPVTLGATDYRHYEIIDGLSEGDIVVFTPENDEATAGKRAGKR